MLKTIDLLETLFAYEQSFPLVQFSHAFQSQAELFHFAIAWQKETDAEFCKGEIDKKEKMFESMSNQETFCQRQWATLTSCQRCFK